MGVQENGSGDMGMSGVPLGSKNKYRRMDSDYSDDDLEVVPYKQTQQERSKSTRKYVFACAVFASLNNVLLGYDVGVMSGAIIFIQEDLKITEFQEEILVGCLSVISLLGSLGGGRASDALGRKWTMGIAAIVFQIGALIMTLAPTFQVLMIGRLLAGVGIGFGVMIAPVYIAEISPTISRGSFTSFPEIFINLGILLGYVSNYVFSGFPSHVNWRIMLAVGILPSVFIAFALCIIPESPRWLVMQNRVDEARSVLMKTNEIEAEVEERLSEILKAAGIGAGENQEEKAVWRELLSPSPSLRRMLVTGFGIQCFQQITGIDATVYYSPEILQTAGIQDKTRLLAATVAVGITKTAFILVAIMLIDKVGRKPLLYVSTIGMTICLCGLAISLSLFKATSLGVALAILSICGNVAFFSIGIGPVCWVLTSEIFPLRLRAQASALGAVGNRVCSGVVAMSFLSVSRAISMAGTFSIFTVLSALSVAFVYKLVPETKGKSLEQIELLFQKDRNWQEEEVELSDTQYLVQQKNDVIAN
ncbi:probable polyol transporter 4 [Cynara cardunculus var. scolymus]|uniref:General substrate transporter n=1 Tax=Cynara cardunculus var. scolymus TaxID=59895 RepID=A0A103XSE1_CYNCS|nr:probable polyol transporter 4 [Cynara cardunculus var. scolymus]KVH95924.1 General substrate transporter [Cynara cardunculus var. scolymus]